MIKQWILTTIGMFVSVHALAHHGDWWWRCGRLECQLPDMPTHPAQTQLLNTTAGFIITLPLQNTWRHHTQHFTPKRFEAPLITKRLDTTTFPKTPGTPYPEDNSTLLAYYTVSVGERYLIFQRNWYDSSIVWSVQWLDNGLDHTGFDSRLE